MGTEFSGVQNDEMGDCTPKWSTFGNPASLTGRGMLMENSILLVVLSTNRDLFYLVHVNPYIPIDSTFQKLQNRIFFKL